MGLCKVNCVPFYFLDSTLGRPFLWLTFTILSHFHVRITKNYLCLSPYSYHPSLRSVRDVFTVPWDKGDRADRHDHRVLPQGECRDNVVDFCLMTVSRLWSPWGKGTKAPRRGEMRRPGVACGLEMDGEPTEPRACLPQGWTTCKVPLGPWAELLWQDREWRPPLALLSLGSPWGWFVCVFFFSYFSSASTQSVAPGIPLDSGHLRQENKLSQK